MKFTTEPMMVVGYGVWEIDGKPVTNKEGEPAEFVQLLDLAADEIHRFTLAGVSNADRVDEMSWAKAICEGRTQARGREDGSVTAKLKVRVVGLQKASPPSKTTPTAS